MVTTATLYNALTVFKCGTLSEALWCSDSKGLWFFQNINLSKGKDPKLDLKSSTS